ncbi:MAG: hypothetical protein LBK93_04205 [Rickettsiales bacterium]|jgi:hypothetical protein|nr:hypothetical protein [Rickettsiales bacterium]
MTRVIRNISEDLLLKVQGIFAGFVDDTLLEVVNLRQKDLKRSEGWSIDKDCLQKASNSLQTVFCWAIFLRQSIRSYKQFVSDEYIAGIALMSDPPSADRFTDVIDEAEECLNDGLTDENKRFSLGMRVYDLLWDVYDIFALNNGKDNIAPPERIDFSEYSIRKISCDMIMNMVLLDLVFKRIAPLVDSVGSELVDTFEKIEREAKESDQELFGRVNKLVSKNEEAVEQLDNLQARMFPGGKRQVISEITKLKSLLDGEYPDEIIKTLFFRCVSRIYICDDRSEERIMMDELAGCLSKKDKSIFYYFILDKVTGMNLDDGMSSAGLAMKKHLHRAFNGRNDDFDETSLNNSNEFGLTVDNPVLAKGISDLYDYVSRLRTLNGHDVSYERSGSTAASNLPMPIDVYEITDNQTGEQLPTVYIYMYGSSTSTKAPKGYKLE